MDISLFTWFKTEELRLYTPELCLPLLHLHYNCSSPDLNKTPCHALQTWPCLVFVCAAPPMGGNGWHSAEISLQPATTCNNWRLVLELWFPSFLAGESEQNDSPYIHGFVTCSFPLMQRSP